MHKTRGRDPSIVGNKMNSDVPLVPYLLPSAITTAPA